MNEAQEARELAYRYSNYLLSWASSYAADQWGDSFPAEWGDSTEWETLYDDDPLEFVETNIAKFPEDALEAFRDWIIPKLIDEVDAPSFLYLSDPKIIRNQWLIHFTNNSSSIAKNGFTQGVDDFSTLGLTTYMSKYEKSHGGYNFAFVAEDNFLRDVKTHDYGGNVEWKYGDEAVLFRASGVQAYHNGDEEYQTIFWGPSAKDIVALSQGYYWKQIEGEDESEEEEGWIVEPCANKESPYGSDDLDDVVGWVMQNFDQYRKMLVCK